MSTPEISGQVHDLILKSGRISTEAIAETPEIPREHAAVITHEQKFLATRMLKCLTVDGK